MLCSSQTMDNNNKMRVMSIFSRHKRQGIHTEKNCGDKHFFMYFNYKEFFTSKTFYNFIGIFSSPEMMGKLLLKNIQSRTRTDFTNNIWISQQKYEFRSFDNNIWKSILLLISCFPSKENFKKQFYSFRSNRQRNRS